MVGGGIGGGGLMGLKHILIFHNMFLTRRWLHFWLQWTAMENCTEAREVYHWEMCGA